MDNKKAIIAMSGGVDSSVAAMLMKEKGYECIGATMKLFDNDDIGEPREKSCCSIEDIEDARSVAAGLGMKYYVFNFSGRFHKEVIDRFVDDYENGRTPNPCIDCNRYLKFDELYRRAREIGYDYVVTGHYARICREDGRYLLKKAVDESKDQSYVLYSLTKEQLAHTLFPLGEMKKTQVRRLAEQYGFINARKRDSQDICFVKNGTYADFIKNYTKKDYPEGKFINLDGKAIGTHRGIIHYTVGQRKGLGISAEHPLFVKEICPETNTVVLCGGEELYTRELTAKNINLISVDKIDGAMRVCAKTRYRQTEQPATVYQLDEDTIRVVFDEPQRAITKGQAVVMYDGDVVVGGGTIQ